MPATNFNRIIGVVVNRQAPAQALTSHSIDNKFLDKKAIELAGILKIGVKPSFEIWSRPRKIEFLRRRYVTIFGLSSGPHRAEIWRTIQMNFHLSPPSRNAVCHDIQIGLSSIGKILKKNCVTLSVSVPVTAFEDGYAVLYGLLDNPDFYAAVESGELTEEQLRLRIGLFHHVASLIPLTPLEFLQWAESLDKADHTQLFIGSRITPNDNFAALQDVGDETLEALTDYLIAWRDHKFKRAA